MQYTVVKQDFPNGWNDATTMDLLTRLAMRLKVHKFIIARCVQENWMIKCI